MGRKGVGVELKETYYRQAVSNAALAAQEQHNLDNSLFVQDEPEEHGAADDDIDEESDDES
jgi:hypothetical protein